MKERVIKLGSRVLTFVFALTIFGAALGYFYAIRIPLKTLSYLYQVAAMRSIN